jgi:hypothetical protein
VAETNGLLNRRTGKSGTEGSNPSVSAKCANVSAIVFFTFFVEPLVLCHFCACPERVACCCSGVKCSRYCCVVLMLRCPGSSLRSCRLLLRCLMKIPRFGQDAHIARMATAAGWRTWCLWSDDLISAGELRIGTVAFRKVLQPVGAVDDAGRH